MIAAAGSKHAAVVIYPARNHVPQHEAQIHRDIAMRIADLLDVPFQGMYDRTAHQGLRCYYVPTDTLLTPALRNALGVEDETDLFGGYADYPFMPTKAITHPLFSVHAQRPDGWSDTFSGKVKSVTLPGYTVFSIDDLASAATYMLREGGPFRLKPVQATAGRGQLLVKDKKEFEAAVAQLDTAALSTHGLVLERHLEEVVTYSVGQVRLHGLTASYIGTQQLTQDNHGHEVYGGSRLQFARGRYEALQGLALADEERLAIEMARRYDEAADACYPGFFASRRNYDVAAGVDAQGERTIGVLEQSWRIGGASRAEIAALEVLAADAQCESLCAETLEIFGAEATAPEDAVETYSGEDPELGLIRKYVRVHANGNKQ